jgi:hypothetical protein
MQAEVREVAIAESPTVDHLDLQVHAFGKAVTMPALELAVWAWSPPMD